MKDGQWVKVFYCWKVFTEYKSEKDEDADKSGDAL